MKTLIITILLVGLCKAQVYTFPEGFKFGVATASYQVEGAWNLSGKGENIWDRLTHERPHLIADGSNGDIACDTYHKTVEDVQLLKDLGVDFYRFSISWSRILPTGFVNVINPDGLRYYNELIDELLANDIEPMVTMYHWDLPQPLQEIGGWPNRILVDIFVDFAQLLYENFGDRVKNWLTFNEPIQICEAGYSSADKAPAYMSQGVACYLCSNTLLLAHAKAYRLYDEVYRATQGGKVGIALDFGWHQPISDTDEEVVQTGRQIAQGWFAHPIFSEEGDYPLAMRQRIAQMSAEEGFPRSRLPEFTPEEVELIRGTADMFGLNHYTSHMCTALPEGWGTRPSHYTDVGMSCTNEDFEGSASSWLKVAPWGLKSILMWIRDEYNNPEVVITENGFSDLGDLNDCGRVNYYNMYLTEVLKAIYEEQCNVAGYTAWSFLDNFEWLRGYTERFGIHHVDFDDPDRPRTLKLSALSYRNILQIRAIDWTFQAEGFNECVI